MRATIVASCLGIHPLSASEPAVVCRSFVSKLSFTIIGTQCSGPVSPSFAKRLSSESAMASASGFSVMSALMAGPCLSYAAMRARYCLDERVAGERLRLERGVDRGDGRLLDA